MDGLIGLWKLTHHEGECNKEQRGTHTRYTQGEAKAEKTHGGTQLKRI